MGFLRDLGDRSLDFWDLLRSLSVTQLFVLTAGLTVSAVVLTLAWIQFTYDPTEDMAHVAAPASLRIDLPAALTPQQRAAMEQARTRQQAQMQALEQPAAPPAPPQARDEPGTPPSPLPASRAAPSPAPAAPAEETKVAAPPRPPTPGDLPPPSRSEPLPEAPDRALQGESKHGPVPKIGSDGRQAYNTYAKPFDRSDPRPRIAIVISGLGLSDAATEAAVQQLPAAVTLSFAPQTSDLQQRIAAARAAGHEVLLDLPMEPLFYPLNDPGPIALLTSLDGKQNVDRLDWVLSRAGGYVGVTNFMGSRFTASADHLRPVLSSLRTRGLLYLDTRPTEGAQGAKIAEAVGLQHATVTLTLDDFASRAAIDAQLAKLEQAALASQVAIGIGQPYPVTLERVANWLPTLARKGIIAAPVSAVASRTGTALR
ncbi:MAG: divergent polysaccharide deacetylase family protein [Acetobacterales bacterium]